MTEEPSFGLERFGKVFKKINKTGNLNQSEIFFMPQEVVEGIFHRTVRNFS